jgi:hypothetical protein
VTLVVYDSIFYSYLPLPPPGPTTPLFLTHTEKDVWALDFDGVLCDSVGESSLSAFKAAEILWPEIFKT